jgi:UDP-glucose 4-epimerase/UDP-arabinose 4-epimerase
MSDPTAILVAGGAGYIGSHTCKALHRSGYLPVTLDNLSTGYAAAVKWGPFVEGDIRDRMLVDDTLRAYGVKGVLHFAAHSLVAESVADPGKYFDNNVGAATSFVNTVIEAGVEAFVFSSTAAVYGAPSASPIPEDHATIPLNPYGASKLAFELALPFLGQSHAFRWNALRYFNAAGADLDGEAGESHDPETHLIPIVCEAVYGKRPPLTVYGDDYATDDGTCIRDYIHVADLADVHVLAIDRLLAGADSGAYNVGTGRGSSVREILSTAEQVLGAAAPHSFGPRRAGDPPSLVADSRRLFRDFGWQPQYSDLATIIRTAARWSREREY